MFLGYNRPYRSATLLTVLCLVVVTVLLFEVLGIKGGIGTKFEQAAMQVSNEPFRISLEGTETQGLAEFPLEELKRLREGAVAAAEVAAESVPVTTPQVYDSKGEVVQYMLAIRGVSSNYFTVRGIKIMQGRAFSEIEQRNGTPVAIVGPSFLTERNGWPSCELGGTLEHRYLDRDYDVVGIAPVGQGLQDVGGDSIFVPYTALPESGRQPRGYRFWVRPKLGLTEEAIEQCEEILGVYNNTKQRVVIHAFDHSQVVHFRVRNSVARSMLTVAVIVLVVALINSANLSLVSIFIRTREIGIRRAVGASRNTVFLEQLFRAVKVSFGAILCGLAVGYGSQQLFERVFAEEIVPGIWPSTLASAIMLAGVIAANLYPAWVASSLPPQLVLRGQVSWGKDGRRFGVRKLLAIVGVGVGVAGIIVIIGNGFVTEQRIAKYMAAAGERTVMVENQSIFDRSASKPPLILTPDLVEGIERQPGVKQAAWYSTMPVVIGVPDREDDIYYGWAVSTLAAYMNIKRFETMHGRELTEADEARPACIVGYDVAMKLFGTSEAVGRQVLVGGGVPYTVVGVLAPRPGGVLDADADRDKTVYMLPSSASFSSDLSLLDEGGKVVIETVSPMVVDRVVQEVKQALAAQHPQYHTPEVKKYLQNIRHLLNIRDRLGYVYGLMGVMSLAIAAVGILNLMMIRVVERTREIGIRRAVGATKPSVAWLFVAEALEACLLGSVMGLAAGIAVIKITSFDVDLPLRVVTQWALIAAGIGAVTGLLGSALPALQAASKSPAEVTRSW